MFRFVVALVCLANLAWVQSVQAESINVTIHRIDSGGIQESLGTVLAEDTDNGLVIHPSLHDLSVGEHGFHLHSNGSCEPGVNPEGVAVAGLMAGGHWDPDGTGSHRGPFGDGHRGDLSRLVVNSEGTTTTEVVAPRLTTNDLRGKALVIHDGGDTYTDTPVLGGGGARSACGVVS